MKGTQWVPFLFINLIGTKTMSRLNGYIEPMEKSPVLSDMGLEGFAIYDLMIGMESTEARIASMEEFLDQFEADSDAFIEKTCEFKEKLDGMETPSMEAIAELHGHLLALGEEVGMRPSISLESLDDPTAYYDLALEAITDFTGRWLQVWANSIKGAVDDFRRLFNNRTKAARKLLARVDEIKSLWDKTKPGLEQNTQIGSYAGEDIFRAFFVGGTVHKSGQIALVKQDIDYSKKMLMDFSSKLSGYVDKLKGIVKSGKFGSEAEVADFVKKINALGKPVELLDNSLKSDKPILLQNNGWKIKYAKPGKAIEKTPEMEKFAEVIAKDTLSMDYHTFSTVRDSMVVVFDDIEFKNNEIDTMLGLLDSYCKVIIQHAEQFEKSMKGHKDLIDAVQSTIKAQKKELSGDALKVLKQLTGFSKNLMKMQSAPANAEGSRVLLTISRISIMMKRIVKRAK